MPRKDDDTTPEWVKRVGDVIDVLRHTMMWLLVAFIVLLFIVQFAPSPFRDLALCVLNRVCH